MLPRIPQYPLFVRRSLPYDPQPPLRLDQMSPETQERLHAVEQAIYEGRLTEQEAARLEREAR